MDEAGHQLNEEVGELIATNGAKDVHSLTSNERGVNVSVVARINANGLVLPLFFNFSMCEKKNIALSSSLLL